MLEKGLSRIIGGKRVPRILSLREFGALIEALRFLIKGINTSLNNDCSLSIVWKILFLIDSFFCLEILKKLSFFRLFRFFSS